jgi:hypothetical protein
MKSTTLRRAAALSAGAALVLTGLASAPAHADATPAGSAATTWLAGELTNGVIHDNANDFDDYGLSIDVALAALSSGNTTVADQVRGAVAAHLNDYITGEAFGDAGSTYAGAAAKALVLAQRTGATPTSFGGVDLVSRVESVTGASGRIADVSSFGDYANSIGQSLAVQGLTAANRPKGSAATAFLLKQQCPAGFFRLALGDAQCADNSAPDTDVTAFAVLALQGRLGDPAVQAAVTRAVAWLKTTQAGDGSFGGGGTTEAANTNSTGLAAAALGAGCEVASADRAAAYVRRFQVGAGTTGPLSTEVGAIAYDQAARTQAQTQGITDATADQWRRATAQAALGLVWDASAQPTVSLQGPKGPVKAGSRTYVTVTGASAGERICLSDGTRSWALDGVDGPLTVPVDLPRTGGPVTLTATTGPGAATTTLTSLAKAKLKTKVAKKVTQGAKAVVTTKKLAAKEKVKVLVDGKLVAKGKANAKGFFRGVFKARLALGKHTLKVVGQFGNRKGTATFTVVR